jgi:hypothetical protein
MNLVRFYECFACCTSMHSYICIVAPHLGTLDEPREGHDIGAEPKNGVWWTYPEDGKAKQVPGWEMLAKQVSSNKHEPSVGSQASPGAF